jgi:hypothetical protein
MSQAILPLPSTENPSMDALLAKLEGSIVYRDAERAAHELGTRKDTITTKALVGWLEKVTDGVPNLNAWSSDMEVRELYVGRVARQDTHQRLIAVVVHGASRATAQRLTAPLDSALPETDCP